MFSPAHSPVTREDFAINVSSCFQRGAPQRSKSLRKSSVFRQTELAVPTLQYEYATYGFSQRMC